MNFAQLLVKKDRDISMAAWAGGGFDSASCDQLEELCGTLVKSKGTVIAAKEGKTSEMEVSRRSSDTGRLPRNPQTLPIYIRMAEIAEKANNEIYNFSLEGFYEDIQYAEYPAGTGFYSWHQDLGIGANHRKLTMIVQISPEDQYEGGDLQVMRSEDVDTMPRGRGTVIFSHPFFCIE